MPDLKVPIEVLDHLLGSGDDQIPGMVDRPYPPSMSAPVARPGAPSAGPTAPPDVGGSVLGTIPMVSSMGNGHPLNLSAPPAKPPSILSNIGHVLGQIGGTALGVVAPGVAAQIPEMPLGKIALASRQRETEAQQSEIGLRGAQTNQANAEAAAAPSRAALESAQADALKTGDWKPVEGTNMEINNRGETRTIQGIQKLPSNTGPEMPLSPQQIQQRNQAYATQYQASNPGKPLPPEFTLQPGSTVGDDARISETLGKTETTADTQANRALTNKELEAQRSQTNEESRQRLDMERQGLSQRLTDAQQKATKPYDDILSEIDESKEYAKEPSATNDYGLLMNFIGVTKPESVGKIRLNAQELKLATGTRSSLGDLEALANRIGNGQMLTKDQRQSMLKTMDVVEKAAIKARDRAAGPQGAAPAGSGENVIRYDAQGNRVNAAR